MEPQDYEDGKAALAELSGWWTDGGEANRNEATTRLHLIDELLTAVLRWPKQEIEAESSHEGKYADYIVGKPHTRLIVEAKREGTYFDLPAGLESGVHELATITDENDAIRDAVEQVLEYSVRRGVPLAAVANGHQLITFLASRQDGVPPLSGKALVFESLSSMQGNFQLVWDNLGVPGVEALNLQTTLGQAETATPPEKLSARIAGYPGYWRRNKIQAELSTVGNLVLQDIPTAPELEREFLARCYSASGTLSEYAMVSKEILEARYSALDSVEAEATTASARRQGGISGDLQVDVSAAGLARRPLILLGDVGVGKTIFIRHFMQVDAKDLMDRSVVLSLDFGREPALASNLNEFVMDHFVDELRDEYDIDVEADNFARSVYSHDLRSFSRGVQGPLAKANPTKFKEKEIALLERKLAKRDQHLQASFRHVTRKQKRQVIVFLDNIDQRGFDFQEKVFLIGQSLAETWPATVFLSLRPETFFRSRSVGSLTAYQPRVFTIEPPDIGAVIKKRLRFCRELVSDSARREQILPAELEHQASLLADYLRILEDSFSSRSGLVEFVENLGGGNARAALGFLNTFVGSGHVDTHKILDIAQEHGRYWVPLHEFVRAIMYGDYRYYDPSASPIANVFEVSSPDAREHFLVPLLLAHIERVGEVGLEEGYVGIDDIIEFAQSLGFTARQIEFAIRHAQSKRLLQRSPRIGDEVARRYRITTVGAYTYKKLVGTFVYLDAMVVDTPITDPSVAGQIADCQEIEDRVRRSKIFRSYLDSTWEPFRGRGTAFDWELVSASIDTDYERIERTLNKRLFD